MGRYEEFAERLIIMLATFLDNREVEQKRAESVSFYLAQVQQLGLPMTLISIEHGEQAIDKARVEAWSGNSPRWRSPRSQRSGAKKAHHIDSMVGGSERVAGLLPAFELVQPIELGGPAGKHARIIFNPREYTESKRRGGAPWRTNQRPSHDDFAGQVVILVIETFRQQ